MSIINNNRQRSSHHVKKNNMMPFRILVFSLTFALITVLLLHVTGIIDINTSANTDPKNSLLDYKKMSVNELLWFGTKATNEYRYPNAETFYEIVLKKEPNNIEALNGVAYAITEQGRDRWPEARNYYKQVLEVSPSNLNANNGYGYLLIKTGEFDKAISFFQTVLDIDSKNVNGLNGLGLSFVGTGDYDKAIKYFETSLDIDSEKIATINGLAFAHYRAEQYDKAEMYYNKSLNESSNDPHALQGLALTFIIQNKPGVDELLDHASKIDHTIINQMIDEGNFLNDLTEHEKASNIFEEILIIEPDNIDALYGKTISLKELKQYNEMGYFLKRILELDDQHVGAITLTKFMNNGILK